MDLEFADQYAGEHACDEQRDPGRFREKISRYLSAVILLPDEIRHS